jgi:4-hydroxy-2-oxoheptanedioate aldolase
LESGVPAVGAWLSLESEQLAETLSYAGFDTVTVDVQHGMFDLGRAIALLRAVAAGPATPMARCSSHDPAEIGKLLDAGAYGIVCPNVDTGEDAARFVRSCRYPPAGARSYGPARGLLYGGPDYLSRANDEILTWAMIESPTAVANAEEILATPGLDGVFLGPKDLGLLSGLPPTLYIPQDLLGSIAGIIEKAHGAGKHVGVFTADADEARRLLAMGADFVTPGSDAGMIAAAAADALAKLRG